MVSPDDQPEWAKEALDKMEMPPTPVSNIEELAVTWREVYGSFRDQDFTESQALYLASCFLLGNPGIAPAH